jgi:TonB-dependent starch-binding outer membrane protein SusC
MLMLAVFSANYALAQGIQVSGTVVDDSGQPLLGASVVGQGTTKGTHTNAKGEFTLGLNSEVENIIVSYAGMLTKVVSVKNEEVGTITMTNAHRAINDVVVVGYGSTKAKNLTSSVASVKAKDFQQGNVTTPEQLILGKVAGVQITSASGAPGAGSRIRIRGGSSLSGDNDPLIVIDGMPVDNYKMGGSANPLNMINPNDIESMDILKDAAATAIYGIRGTNGVILITTKRGSKKSDHANISFSSTNSLATLGSRRVDMLNANEFRDLANLKLDAAGRALIGNDSTDWVKAITRTAKSSDNNISISGGLGNLPYRVSFGYLAQQGIVVRSGLDRYSGAFSLSPSFLKNSLKFDINLKNTRTNTLFADEGGAIGSAYSFVPTKSIYSSSPDGAYGGYTEWQNAGALVTIAPKNPLGLLMQRTSRSLSTRTIGNIQAEYRLPFFPALKAVINTGMDMAKTAGNEYVDYKAAQFFTRGGKSADYGESRISNLLDMYLNYNKNLAQYKSNIDATAGYSYQKQTKDYPSFNDYNMDTIYAAAGNPFKSTRVLIGFFGRVNYAYANKYLLGVSLRQDYASIFAEGKKGSFFPAISAGWRVTEESFMKDYKFVNNLKVRASIGRTGNASLYLNSRPVDYLALPKYTISDPTAQYQFGNSFYNMYRPEGIDKNISWEKTTTRNLGIDYGFLKNRIYGTFDVYSKVTKDLFGYVNVPAGTNLTNRILTNTGSLSNKGFEFGLNLVPIATKNVTWEFGFNYTHNVNKIISLNKLAGSNDSSAIETGGIDGGAGNTIQVFKPGNSINSFFVYQQVYDLNGKPVEGVYVDQNKDGIINGKDKIVFNNGEPRNIMGFSSSLSIAKFTFGFIARAQTKAYAYNNIASNMGSLANLQNQAGYLNNIHGSYFDTRFNSQQLLSNYYVENASFFKLDNVSAGYNFGAISKTNASSNLRITAMVQNVFMITKYSGLDPEVMADGQGGIDKNYYPRARTYSLGLRLDF